MRRPHNPAENPPEPSAFSWGQSKQCQEALGQNRSTPHRSSGNVSLSQLCSRQPYTAGHQHPPTPCTESLSVYCHQSQPEYLPSWAHTYTWLWHKASTWTTSTSSLGLPPIQTIQTRILLDICMPTSRKECIAGIALDSSELVPTPKKQLVYAVYHGFDARHHDILSGSPRGDNVPIFVLNLYYDLSNSV